MCCSTGQLLSFFWIGRQMLNRVWINLELEMMLLNDGICIWDYFIKECQLNGILCNLSASLQPDLGTVASCCSCCSVPLLLFASLIVPLWPFSLWTIISRSTKLADAVRCLDHGVTCSHSVQLFVLVVPGSSLTNVDPYNHMINEFIIWRRRNSLLKYFWQNFTRLTQSKALQPKVKQTLN